MTPKSIWDPGHPNTHFKSKQLLFSKTNLFFVLLLLLIHISTTLEFRRTSLKVARPLRGAHENERANAAFRRDRPRAACPRRSTAAGPAGCPPYPGSSPSRCRWSPRPQPQKKANDTLPIVQRTSIFAFMCFADLFLSPDTHLEGGTMSEKMRNESIRLMESEQAESAMIGCC